MRILRSFGVNGSEEEGKENMWIIVGTFSADGKKSGPVKEMWIDLTKTNEQ
jgi:hypothetical protein